jgi:hypothetical protein
MPGKVVAAIKLGSRQWESIQITGHCTGMSGFAGFPFMPQADTPLTYIRYWRMLVMVFIETSIFTRLVCQLMEDEQYRELQSALIENPQAGTVIQGSGGLRKIRWRLADQGKRGGVRVIYYGATRRNEIYMLYIYSKNVRSDLTHDQLRQLRQVVREFKK